MRSPATWQELVWGSTVAIIAILAAAISFSVSAIVEVVVVGLILAGLAALKLKQPKSPERVPVRVRVEPDRR